MKINNSCQEKRKFSLIMNNLYLFLIIAITIINLILLVIYTDIVKNIQESDAVRWAAHKLAEYLPKYYSIDHYRLKFTLK